MVVCASGTHLTVVAARNQYISPDGIKTLERGEDLCFVFTCGLFNRDESIFNFDRDEIRSGGFIKYMKSLFKCIQFEGCQFREINSQYFVHFKSLKEFNISDVELDSLQPTLFEGANSLTHLIVSHNRLTEIPARLFTAASKLTHVDLSHNSIERVDPLAFETMKQLLSIDLSYNNITNLSDHTFDPTIQLRFLNMSFNSIGDFKAETLAFMPNLEHLNLRHNNISSIQMGTFAHQHKLVGLQLSENHLKKFDFKLFFPIMNDLTILGLGGNQLRDLNGFRKELFPRLYQLDIINNRFNCSYLQRFMEMVDWNNLYLHVDPQSNKPADMSIRGITCNGTIHDSDHIWENNHFDENQHLEKSLNELNLTLVKLNSNANNNSFVEVVLVLILIAVSAIFAVLFILHRKLILNQSKRATNKQSATHSAELAETQLL